MNGSHVVSPATAVRLIARRELNTRLRTRGFLIGTAVILLVMVGYMVLQANVFSARGTTTIGLSGQTSSMAAPLRVQAEQLDESIEISTVTDPRTGRAQVEDGELDALVSGNAADPRVLVKSELDPQLRVMLNEIAQTEVLGAKLAEAGQDAEQVLETVGSTTVEVSSIEEPDPESGQRLVVGLVMMFLLYMSITTYGSLVAQGIVEEKSSRVVEILLATVRPWQLLLGKVIGLGLVGLVQLAILGGVGLVMATSTGVLTVSGVATTTLLWGLLWYLLGFFLYATVFAAAGSLVSRQEDMQSVLTPITLVLIIGFITGFTVVEEPASTAATVLSLLPPLSPILMPTRIAAGSAGPMEIVAALVLTLAAIALLTWLGGKIYQTAILRTGSRMKLKDALKG
ncbi:ABC transporter permease [Amycolatopsis cihanbeyliensis]|uniref:ABC-2 type transport system permease protein n=1 Tax=Amycolatopsis cihanbeyliensis TaxID=1128664 RepID=A0A542DID8_AMYCI|nr:ABC transporter permease [Amycolatopsis cihanbeyliensis]TQJ02843.1 ABC-2 type transport system permease protein [Amycolatopsis cihanbeyliensis]